MKRVFLLTFPKFESSLFSIKIHFYVKQKYIFFSRYLKFQSARVKLCRKEVSINVSSAMYGVPSQKSNKYNVLFI